MTVTEVNQSLGSWELRLREDTPKEVREALTYFGHIAVMPGNFDPALYRDNLLAQARFVGVFRSRGFRDDLVIGGSGLAYWLGDEDDKGDIHETAVVLSGNTFAESVTALLPPAGGVAPGTIHSVPGTYSGKHQWVTPRQALTYVTDTFGAEWRIRGDAVQKVVLDAGTVSQLFVTTPKALIVSKDFGRDMDQVALPGRAQLDTDVTDLTTRVVLLAEGEGDSISTGNANASPTIYKNLRGQPVKLTRLISESGTDATNAAARAQLQLNRFTGLRKSVNLSTFDYDVKGQFVVGDYINVYDPDNGFYDPSREVFWKGQPINPVALRCVEMTWPIPKGWTVGFRDIDGNWIDLSPWYVPESGETQVVVGTLSRSLTQLGAEPVGVRPNLPNPGEAPPDATIPAAPTWGQESTGSYQPDNGEWTKAAVFLSWNQPLNGDGSTITDGGHYEIRYRVKSYIGYRVRWGQLNTYRWGELSSNKWGAPITDPVQASGEWHTVYVAWGQTQTLVQELTPGVEYEFQIRAVDAANPPKHGPWSDALYVVASEDLFAPDVPAAPVVASSRIALQVIHTLGKASGGTFNLQPDLVYMSVHVGGSSSFFPDETNEVGKLIANASMIQAQIPAVQTFQIEQTDDVWVRVVAVDRAGNKSGPSDAVQASVDLIDDAHISDLTVSKVTAGTIMAQWIMAGSIKTSESGARVELSNAGLEAYNPWGERTVRISSADGSATFTGRLQTELNQTGIEFYTSGGIARSRWSVNSGGAPLDHIVSQYAANFGEPWGQGWDCGIRKRAGEVQDGGKILMFEKAMITSYQPEVGDERLLGLGWPYSNAATIRSPNGEFRVETSNGGIYLDATAGSFHVTATGSQEMLFNNDTGNFQFIGKFPNYIFADPKQAIFTVGDSTAGTAPVLPSYSYGPTMVRNLWPIVSARASSDTMVRVASHNTTGFTAGISAGGAVGLIAWCIAM